MQFIDLKTQYKHIKTDVLKEINEVLESGQYIMGDKVEQLEHVLADYVQVKHCITVADGTKALLITLMALGIKADDEIIVPSFTFIATCSMALLLGAKPVFVDIDAQTYNLNPQLIEAAITPKTKAIIAVSLFGQNADYSAIRKIADKYKITLIEDAAQSFGAMTENKRACSLATISCTSFFPSKPLGCYGDGGACFTNDDELNEKMRWIRIHGQQHKYQYNILGVNGRLDTIQAGVLLAKMRIFEQEVIARNMIGQRYTDLLHDINCITPVIAPKNSHIYAQYSILVKNRDAFVLSMLEQGVPTAIHYPLPLHRQPPLQHLHNKQVPLDVSDYVAQNIVSLPMHPYLDELTQDKIVAAVQQSIQA